MAIPVGFPATAMGGEAVIEARTMGVTELVWKSATSAVWLLGVTVTATGWMPAGIGAPARSVGNEIGVTVLSPRLATSASLPLGVTATASGSKPTDVEPTTPRRA